eukprot:3439365-Rhodomonas_salina.2
MFWRALWLKKDIDDSSTPRRCPVPLCPRIIHDDISALVRQAPTPYPHGHVKRRNGSSSHQHIGSSRIQNIRIHPSAGALFDAALTMLPRRVLLVVLKRRDLLPNGDP